jgi:hypothetical protein
VGFPGGETVIAKGLNYEEVDKLLQSFQKETVDAKKEGKI